MKRHGRRDRKGDERMTPVRAVGERAIACWLRVGRRAVPGVDVPMRVGRRVRCSDVLFVKPAGLAVGGLWLGLDERVEEGAAAAVDADRLVQ